MPVSRIRLRLTPKFHSWQQYWLTWSVPSWGKRSSMLVAKPWIVLVSIAFVAIEYSEKNEAKLTFYTIDHYGKNISYTTLNPTLLLDLRPCTSEKNRNTFWTTVIRLWRLCDDWFWNLGLRSHWWRSWKSKSSISVTRCASFAHQTFSSLTDFDVLVWGLWRTITDKCIRRVVDGDEWAVVYWIEGQNVKVHVIVTLRNRIRQSKNHHRHPAHQEMHAVIRENWGADMSAALELPYEVLMKFYSSFSAMSLNMKPKSRAREAQPLKSIPKGFIGLLRDKFLLVSLEFPWYGVHIIG